MKVILLKNIAKLGKVGETKDVSDGYARNFLILKNLALPASPKNTKKIELELKSKKAQKERAHEEFHNLKAALSERGIVVKKKTDAKGGFYSAVSGPEILEALKALDFPLPDSFTEENIKLENHIKTPGKHEAKIVFGQEEIKLQILCESVF